MQHPKSPRRGISMTRRLALITRAAWSNRPVEIRYDAANPCHPDAGDRRVIAVHDVRTSRDGNIVLRAWCALCGKVESFLLSRIRAHRTLRRRWIGPVPPVTPYFTVFGRVGSAWITRPLENRFTASGLLARVRERTVRRPLAASDLDVIA
ncbi:WYL domain-containing protein [Streptomyces sp. NPDC001709]